MPRQQSKRSADPIQQALRDHKKQWNANCSEVIGQLIALKRGLNGKGDNKIGLPPGSIKDPIPNEVSGLLTQLAGEFQQLVGGAQGIVQEQSEYSKNRRKPRPKGQQAPQSAAPDATSPPTEKVVDNLGRLGNANYDLEALGSNPLTRAWAYLSSIFTRKEFAKERMGLLSITADLYKHLLDLENNVLVLGKESIPRSIGKYQLAKYKFETLKRSFMKIEGILVEKAKREAPEVIPQASEPQDPIDAISEDIVKEINEGGNRSILDPLINIIGDYEKEENPRTKKMIQKKIIQLYDMYLKRPKNVADKEASDNEILIKEAGNPMGRWLRRQLVKALKFNRSAAPRLEVVEALDEVKKNIKQLMDILEGHSSIEEIGRLIVAIGKGLEEISRPMGILSIMFQETFYAQQKGKKYDSWRGQKGHPPEYNDRFLDRMMNLKMKRDLSRGLV